MSVASSLIFQTQPTRTKLLHLDRWSVSCLRAKFCGRLSRWTAPDGQVFDRRVAARNRSCRIEVIRGSVHCVLLVLTPHRSALKVVEVDLANARSHVLQFQEISKANEEALIFLNATYDQFKASTESQIATYEVRVNN